MRQRRRVSGKGTAKETGAKSVLKDGTEAESVIQGRILRWLKKTGLLYWRQNSGKVFVHGRCIVLGPNGLPDIVVVVPPGGKFLALEVKSAKGKQRPEQVVFEKKLKSVGGYYFLVRSLAEAKQAVDIVGGHVWMEWLKSASALDIHWP